MKKRSQKKYLTTEELLTRINEGLHSAAQGGARINETLRPLAQTIARLQSSIETPSSPEAPENPLLREIQEINQRLGDLETQSASSPEAPENPLLREIQEINQRLGDLETQSQDQDIGKIERRLDRLETWKSVFQWGASILVALLLLSITLVVHHLSQ